MPNVYEFTKADGTKIRKTSNTPELASAQLTEDEASDLESQEPEDLGDARNFREIETSPAPISPGENAEQSEEAALDELGLDDAEETDHAVGTELTDEEDAETDEDTAEDDGSEETDEEEKSE